MFKKTIAATVSAAALLSAAQAGVGADVTVGTPGVSGSLHLQVTPFVTLRGSYNFFEFDFDDQEYDDIVYDAGVDFSQVGGFVDVHPFMNGFTVTGGVLFGERRVDLSATPTEGVEIGGFIFRPEEVGSLEGDASFGDTAYYAGIGWDSTTHGLMPVSLVVRAGVAMTDSPTVFMQNVGGIDDPLIQAEIDQRLQLEIAELESEFEDFRFFPMISVGIGVGF
ncbi:hypothetical protein [Parvularcula maris]|uniref:Outer membrane protein beta-barrel domain-containing protein n=1 Tax=Parvularcula maris TaxID=2965077 RepID=A0A9X2L7D0_9PROT|nr:hypothetical protein [Parvularcula maris]MCQ8184431.1 hypothetical protein [Parvularcula maris]